MWIDGRFWLGVAIGVAAYWAWMKYRDQKAQ